MPERPNVVFMLADDLRFDAVGYVNSGVRSPQLDRLAADGVRFHHAFVTTSICCTSRASIFTGLYARRHGVWDFTTSLSAEALAHSYPAVLKAAGYRTGFFGKYGVGDYEKGDENGDGIGPFPRVPDLDRDSFDEIEDFDTYYEAEDADREHHHTERVADYAERFIRSSSSQQPFCLSLSFKAPHANDIDDLIMGQYVAEPDILPLYGRDIFTQGPTMNEQAYEMLPPFIKASEGRQRWYGRFSTPWLWQDSVRKYYALMTGIDRAIGRVVAALEERGLLGSTAIVFTSDNGYFLGDYGLSDKWFGYEASIRIPLMIRPAGPAVNRDITAPVLNIDFAPTIIAMAGLEPPDVVHGRDLSPLWTRAASDSWRTDFLYEHYLPGLTDPDPRWEAMIPSSEGVRNERYTYLRYPRQSGTNEQLFDRVADPDELVNIIDSAPPRLVAELRARTDQLIAEHS